MLIVAVAIAIVVVLWLGRATTFFYDEWYIFQEAGPAGSPGVRGLFEPNNGHLGAVSFAVYRILLHTVGAEHYLPYRLIVLGLHVGLAVGSYLYARTRVHPVVAAAMAVLLLFFGSGWQMILWPAGMSFILPVGASVWMLLLLDRGTRASTLGAGALVALALGTSAVGVPVALAGLVEAARPVPRWRLRLAAMTAPLLLFLVWYVLVGRGDAASVPDSSWTLQAGYLYHSAAAAAAGLFRGVEGQGAAALAILLVLLVAGVARQRRLPARLVTVLVLPGTFWALTALSRAGLGEPGASRYLYAGGVWLLLVLVEASSLLVGTRISVGARAAVLALLAVVLVPQISLLGAGAGGLREDSAVAKGALAAMGLYRDKVPPDFAPNLEVMPNVRAAPYFAAVDAFGTPTFAEQELITASPAARAAADKTLLAIAPVRSSAAAPLVEGCEELASGTHELSAPGSELSIQTSVPVQVSVRRFSDQFSPASVFALPAGAQRLRFGADRLLVRAPWRLEVTSAAAFAVCR